MIAWIAIAALVVCAVVIVIARERIARLQSLLAGGSIVPGCVVAEAVAVLILALLIYHGHRAGYF